MFMTSNYRKLKNFKESKVSKVLQVNRIETTKLFGAFSEFLSRVLWKS